MEKGYIEIWHKEKGAGNRIVHRRVYAGACLINARYSVREQTGGVENNSEIAVRIFGRGRFPLACGDRCMLNGAPRTIRCWSRCGGGNVSCSFSHVALSLR